MPTVFLWNNQHCIQHCCTGDASLFSCYSPFTQLNITLFMFSNRRSLRSIRLLFDLPLCDTSVIPMTAVPLTVSGEEFGSYHQSHPVRGPAKHREKNLQVSFASFCDTTFPPQGISDPSLSRKSDTNTTVPMARRLG